eukprot:CAMPEP_0171083794 /NCGR_PEP_ID=MMETSP0766_2-20121228/17932_1 /TAXON_ID=439317 /ORGANISM="Gambierdiscus australes, Strain CAWD 149" /LENGTH=52 /DNA_ID=CAMNT_0011541249 /DNA_START=30 /DNA_END=186 /DNA_ORIENTATION=-
MKADEDLKEMEARLSELEKDPVESLGCPQIVFNVPAKPPHDHVGEAVGVGEA